ETVWMLLDVPDKQYLYIQFRDRAGNIANTVAETIYRELITYTIRTDKFGMGNIEPADPLTGEILVNEGSDQTVKITPNPDYEIDRVSVDGSSINLDDLSYTFENVQSDHELSVRFRSIQHTISIFSSQGGWISPCVLDQQCTGTQAFSGEISVESGSNQSFTIVPSSGYEINSLLIDGQAASITQTIYTLEQINSNHSISVTFRKTQTSPIISDISNMSFNENTSNNTFNVEVMDTETASSELIIEFHSDNEDLIPKDNIVLAGIFGDQRTYSISPSPNKFGVVTITVKVTDTDQMTALKAFDVQVNNVFYPPNISTIDNQTVVQNGISGPHNITISSQDAGILTVYVETSNTVLMPTDRIYFSYNDQTGNSPFSIPVIGGQLYPIQLTLEPVEGQSGSASVTITISDQQSLSESQYFQFEVVKQNHPPVLSLINNQSIDENTSTGKITFTVSDADGGAITLTGLSSCPSLVKPAKIVFYNGSHISPSILNVLLSPDVQQNLSLQVTPEANQWGACNIMIEASDDTNLKDISNFGLGVKEFIPNIKTFYGFVYNDYFMGMNDVQISLVQPEIEGYSTVTLTQLGTGPNGRTGDGYFAIQLPENDDIYYFNTVKTAYKSITFNTSLQYIENENENSVFFKPLYLTDCNNNQFIAGSIERNGSQTVDISLISNNKLILREKINASQFSFCVSNAVFD
ncbi:hypothetical protein MHK_007582, partial [Candidatus Magnetomorum sp. HK-1]